MSTIVAMKIMEVRKTADNNDWRNAEGKAPTAVEEAAFVRLAIAPIVVNVVQDDVAGAG
jgi:hypothetical protein